MFVITYLRLGIHCFLYKYGWYINKRQLNYCDWIDLDQEAEVKHVEPVAHTAKKCIMQSGNVQCTKQNAQH